MSADVFRIVFYDFTLGYDASYDSCSYQSCQAGTSAESREGEKGFSSLTLL
jgi:hypothetical protein